MTKKEYCEKRPTVAYYSGMGGLEAKFIEYGTDDYVYLVAGAWNGNKTYHKLKVHYGNKYDYITKSDAKREKPIRFLPFFMLSRTRRMPFLQATFS